MFLFVVLVYCSIVLAATHLIPTARKAIMVLSGSFIRNCLGSLSPGPVPPVIIVFSLSCVILVVA